MSKLLNKDHINQILVTPAHTDAKDYDMLPDANSTYLHEAVYKQNFHKVIQQFNKETFDMLPDAKEAIDNDVVQEFNEETFDRLPDANNEAINNQQIVNLPNQLS